MISSQFSRSQPVRQSGLAGGRANLSCSSSRTDVFSRELESAHTSLSAQDKDWATLVQAWSKKKI